MKYLLGGSVFVSGLQLNCPYTPCEVIMIPFPLMSSLSCYLNDLHQLIEFNPERAVEDLKSLLHELIKTEQEVTDLLIKADNERRELIKQSERYQQNLIKQSEKNQESLFDKPEPSFNEHKQRIE